MREVRLNSIKNVRDLGGLGTRDGRMVKRGIFFRGSSLHKASPQDAWTLREDLNIGCVIDLRCGWELESKPNVKIEGVEYLHIPFYDKEIVGVDYEKSAPGTIRTGHDFACIPSDFYRSLANPLTVSQMRNALHEAFLHASEDCAIYQHCSGGKDRTGVMSMLLLTILGVHEDDIMQDYLLTNQDRDSDIAHVRGRFLRLAQGNERLADELTESHRAKPEHLSAFKDAVKEEFGSMEAFFEKGLGMDGAMREQARDKFTVPSSCSRKNHSRSRNVSPLSWTQDSDQRPKQVFASMSMKSPDR